MHRGLGMSCSGFKLNWKLLPAVSTESLVRPERAKELRDQDETRIQGFSEISKSFGPVLRKDYCFCSSSMRSVSRMRFVLVRAWILIGNCSSVF